MRSSDLLVRLLRMRPNIAPLQPHLVPIRLETFHERVHRNLDHVLAAGALRGALAVLHPTFGGEIRRLGAVEAVIEAGVVAVRERDHYLALLLRDLVVGYGVLLEDLGGDEGHLVAQEGLAGLVTAGEEAVGQTFQSAAVLWWYCVPAMRWV